MDDKQYATAARENKDSIICKGRRHLMKATIWCSQEISLLDGRLRHRPDDFDIARGVAPIPYGRDHLGCLGPRAFRRNACIVDRSIAVWSMPPYFVPASLNGRISVIAQWDLEPSKNTVPGVRRQPPRLRSRVAPPLRGVKGAHETPHKSPLRSDWWRSSRTSLDPASLRGGFAGSKAKAARGVAWGFARKARRWAKGSGKETEMHELMPREIAETVPALYAIEEEDDPVARVRLFSCISGWTWLVTE